jgi:hypothetical protein
LPLSEVNNAVLKELVAKASEGAPSPKTITDNYSTGREDGCCFRRR